MEKKLISNLSPKSFSRIQNDLAQAAQLISKFRKEKASLKKELAIRTQQKEKLQHKLMEFKTQSNIAQKKIKQLQRENSVYIKDYHQAQSKQSRIRQLEQLVFFYQRVIETQQTDLNSLYDAGASLRQELDIPDSIVPTPVQVHSNSFFLSIKKQIQKLASKKEMSGKQIEKMIFLTEKQDLEGLCLKLVKLLTKDKKVVFEELSTSTSPKTLTDFTEMASMEQSQHLLDTLTSQNERLARLNSQIFETMASANETFQKTAKNQGLNQSLTQGRSLGLNYSGSQDVLRTKRRLVSQRNTEVRLTKPISRACTLRNN